MIPSVQNICLLLKKRPNKWLKICKTIFFFVQLKTKHEDVLYSVNCVQYHLLGQSKCLWDRKGLNKNNTEQRCITFTSMSIELFKDFETWFCYWVFSVNLTMVRCLLSMHLCTLRCVKRASQVVLTCPRIKYIVICKFNKTLPVSNSYDSCGSAGMNCKLTFLIIRNKMKRSKWEWNQSCSTACY